MTLIPFSSQTMRDTKEPYDAKFLTRKRFINFDLCIF